MNQTARLATCTAQDYLRAEEAAPVKHEYVDGSVHAMAGAGERHNRIALNVAYRLRTAARGSDCGVYISDMKLRIAAQNVFYYPDVMLVCRPEDDHPHYKTAPCVVVEVFSPSTAAVDRREKWAAYRRIEDLNAYLLVDSEARRVEVFQCDADGGWRQGELGADEVLNLECGNLRVPLSLDDVYEDVRGLG